jgi:translation initiation factor 2 alpha subunit (eIF-2alpha)
MKLIQKCFKELKEEIETTWNAVLKADLLNTIGWMYDALEHEVSNGNPILRQFPTSMGH